MEPTRVLLVDDHQMFREGLRRLLESEKDIRVVGEADDGHAASELASSLSPDVVVMDISMPHMDGIRSTCQIRNGKVQGQGPRVIALSGHSDRRLAAEMLGAGAAGYVLKASASGELIQAVRSAMANSVYVSPEVAGTLAQEFVNDARRAASDGLLSPREQQIVRLLAEGKATKEVATALHISVKTVESHRRNIMEKLNFGSLAELIKYALREGLATMDV